MPSRRVQRCGAAVMRLRPARQNGKKLSHIRHCFFLHICYNIIVPRDKPLKSHTGTAHGTLSHARAWWGDEFTALHSEHLKSGVSGWTTLRRDSRTSPHGTCCKALHKKTHKYSKLSAEWLGAFVHLRPAAI